MWVCRPYDGSQIEDFFEEIVAYIDDDLNPFVKELSSLEYEAGKHGGSKAVANFSCQESGKNGVSVMEDFMPKLIIWTHNKDFTTVLLMLN